MLGYLIQGCIYLLSYFNDRVDKVALLGDNMYVRYAHVLFHGPENPIIVKVILSGKVIKFHLQRTPLIVLRRNYPMIRYPLQCQKGAWQAWPWQF